MDNHFADGLTLLFAQVFTVNARTELLRDILARRAA